ncbi:MAG: GTPase ObgE [Bacillota bacterium]
MVALFIDRAKIMVTGGDGGDGAVAFRREKHIPKGGPDGGDGGAGGDVLLVVREGLTTLSAFRRRSHFRAGHGARGRGKKMSGGAGENVEIPVPPGTVVKDDGGRLIADMIEVDQRQVVARGGRGGRGNARFASSRFRTPRFAEKGEPGEERWIQLELKLLADVGLIGLPNAGKSTLLSVVSAARPEIADYPFTTLEPNLGVVNFDYDRSFVVADLPGLISGAHEGVGLGDEFLRHAERTSVLMHLVDLADPGGRSPRETFSEIDEELEAYDADLYGKPRVVVGTKIDLPGTAEAWDEFRPWVESRGHRAVSISAVTRSGVEELLGVTWELLVQARREDQQVRAQQPTGFRVYRVEGDERVRIQRTDDGWVVRDSRYERWVKMTDMDNDEAVEHLNHRLRRSGLYDLLEEAGVREGDAVRIADEEFEYEPW